MAGDLTPEGIAAQASALQDGWVAGMDYRHFVAEQHARIAAALLAVRDATRAEMQPQLDAALGRERRWRERLAQASRRAATLASLLDPEHGSLTGVITALRDDLRVED